MINVEQLFQLTCFHLKLQEEGEPVRNELELAATRNMWSGMQSVAVRGILTGGGKEEDRLGHTDAWSGDYHKCQFFS